MTRRHPALRHMAEGLGVGVVAIAIVTAVVAVLNEFLPLLSLTSLYLFAIVPIAIGWGFGVAGIVAVASYVTFIYFIAPPVHTFRVADSDNATGLVIALVTAYVVSQLARRAQAGATEAKSRAEEAEQAREQHRRIADEQAALRRVATLVAGDVAPPEVFQAVAVEAVKLLGADLAALVRVTDGDTADAVVVWGAEGSGADRAARSDVTGRWSIDGDGLTATIARTGRPARRDDWTTVEGPLAAFARDELGIRSSVGSPVVVGGRVWGALIVDSKRQPLAPETEVRLSNFADLVATSVANAQSREDVRRLADEQAALRRVATLVAKAAPTSEIFEAVTREVGLQCDADLARMERFEEDRTVTAVAAWTRAGESELAVGRRFALEGESIAAQVRETGRPARVDTFAGAAGPIAREARALGIHASVGCPIAVGARPWGVIAASTTREEPFPPNTESRIAGFTELVATAVSNVEARGALVASRARLLTAADDARRDVVRDLHDGAQQSLVSLILTLKRAQEDDAAEPVMPFLAKALDQAEHANAELRELVHGILPAILTRGGLAAGVRALVRRLNVPVSVDVPDGRFAPEVEASAYFLVAEALTNVAKHSGAQRANVAARVDDGLLLVEVQDDGIGGARRDGSGLLGLDDRVAALGGRLRIESAPGRGTRIAAALPLRH